MKILLIPGHGNGDPGAVGNGYREADLTRQMATLIKAELSKYATVDIANTAVNWYRKIIKYGEYFNFKQYDYVLEIHFNSSPGTNADGKTTGTEIYITRAVPKGSIEEKTAENIVRNISALGFKNRGVKRTNFDLIYHIKKQGVPAALLEVCFINDTDDMKLYKAKSHAIAEAVAVGIADGYKLKKQGADDLTKTDVINIIKEYEAQKAKEAAGTWAADAMNKAKAKGIMDGSSPKSPATREQIAVILNRLGLLK